MSALARRSRRAQQSLACGLVSCGLWLSGCAHTPEPGVTAGTAQARTTPSAAPVPFVSPLSYQDFIRAELYAARGQHAQAVEAYRAARELGDGDPYLTARLAEALDHAGQAREARAEVDHALTQSPRSEALLLASARIARRQGDAASALAAYARAQDAARTPGTALEHIAYLRELGSQERAIEALRSLAPKHRGSVRDRLRIELELALLTRRSALTGCARDWLALGGGDPGLSRRTAAALLDDGHAALALELLDAVPASEADTPLRLRATLALGRSAECEHLLSSMPPHWLGGPLAMADAYLQAGRPEEALRVLAESDLGQDDPAMASKRATLIARSLAAAGRPRDASALLDHAGLDRAGTRAATCEALEASGLLALARDAGCAGAQ